MRTDAVGRIVIDSRALRLCRDCMRPLFTRGGGGGGGFLLVDQALGLVAAISRGGLGLCGVAHACAAGLCRGVTLVAPSLLHLQRSHSDQATKLLRVFPGGPVRLLNAQPDGAAFRLLGIAATELAPAQGADEDDLIAGDGGREKSREAAIAALRDKFGPAAVQRGLTFQPGPRTK